MRRNGSTLERLFANSRLGVALQRKARHQLPLPYSHRKAYGFPSWIIAHLQLFVQNKYSPHIIYVHGLRNCAFKINSLRRKFAKYLLTRVGMSATAIVDK